MFFIKAPIITIPIILSNLTNIIYPSQLIYRLSRPIIFLKIIIFKIYCLLSQIIIVFYFFKTKLVEKNKIRQLFVTGEIVNIMQLTNDILV